MASLNHTPLYTRHDEKYRIADDDIHHYHEKGYLILKNVFHEAEIDKIEHWFDHFTSGQEREHMGKDFCDMSQPYETPFEEYQLVNAMLPSKYRPELTNNIIQRVTQHIAAQLYTSGEAALDYEQFLAKKPQKANAEFAMHQDLGYWPKTPNTWTATFSVAITPSNRLNGCLQVIPGSNKEPELRKHAPKPYHSETKDPSALRDESHLLVIDSHPSDQLLHLPVKRGDVTVHDERIVHGSAGNQSDSWRKTYVLAYRDINTIAQERAAGFTHSHNDQVNWDEFIS